MSNSTAECSGIYTYLGSTHVSYVCTSPIHIPSDNIGSRVPEAIPRWLYEMEFSDRSSHLTP